MAPSTIPGAGYGLFALSNRSKGDRIVAYTGESLSVSALEERYPKGDVGVYCLAISSSVFIDSALSRGVGASANASRNGAKPNAKFVLDVRGGSARLEATRCIRAGDEIFVSYGVSIGVAQSLVLTLRLVFRTGNGTCQTRLLLPLLPRELRR